MWTTAGTLGLPEEEDIDVLLRRREFAAFSLPQFLVDTFIYFTGLQSYPLTDINEFMEVEEQVAVVPAPRRARGRPTKAIATAPSQGECI